MTPCPFCLEPINDAAIVCRFCGRDLAGAKRPASAGQAVALFAFGLILLVIGIFVYVSWPR